jgi:hypothetical protein
MESLKLFSWQCRKHMMPCIAGFCYIALMVTLKCWCLFRKRVLNTRKYFFFSYCALLNYDTVQSGRLLSRFRRDLLLLSSGRYYIYPEYGRSMFIQDNDNNLQKWKLSHSIRSNSGKGGSWEKCALRFLFKSNIFNYFQLFVRQLIKWWINCYP